MKIQYHLKDIKSAANELLKMFPHQKCFAFYAEMGSGKTTLINEMCKQIGVEEKTSSPTFSIINEYQTKIGNRVFHLDLYRLKGVQDAIEAGVGDVLAQSENYCLIEWPEIAEVLLDRNCVRLKINFITNEEREIVEID